MRNHGYQSVCFWGTKAQFIKMVPVLMELDRRSWKYRIIDTGQHSGLITEIVKEFEVREPDVKLYGNADQGVSTLTQGLRWGLSLAWKYLPRARTVRRNLFGGATGISLVHGDTMSTLLATLIAKRGGQKVAHVEAGLRSWRYLNPFPEELIRVIVMHLADYLFAPSAGAFENLAKMSLSARAYRLSGNTVLDTVAKDLRRTPKSLPELPPRYSLATLHRLETIYQRRRLQWVVKLLLEANQRQPLVFVQHAPTVKRLRAYGLERVLAQAGVRQIPLLDHVSFLHLLKDASFLLTDGGSIQEEASYLGVPCLLLRSAAERTEGLGGNVVLSGLKDDRAQEFLDNFATYRRPKNICNLQSPSVAIADLLADISKNFPVS